MDSAGNEVIIVDDRAQTNGFNGNYSEEVVIAAAAAAAAAAASTSSEMKTRSKVIANSGGPGEAAKLRSRAAANVANSHSDKAPPASPASSVISSSNVSTSAAAAAAASSSSSSSSSSDKDKKMNLRSGVADSQAESGSGKATSSADKKNTGLDGTPGPKSGKKGAGSVAGDREDDSGINSRSSSVSTDDTYSSRLRTRSKRAEALTSSTPASVKKSSSRMPLSTYDFDDDSMILQIDEDASTSGSSLKRKATKVLVEEMEEDEPAAGTAAQDEDEPPVKVTVRRTSFFSVLLNPLKAFRGKLFLGSQPEEQNEKPAANVEDPSQTNVSKVSDEGPKTEHAASQTENHNSEATAATNEDGKETSSTCMVM